MKYHEIWQIISSYKFKSLFIRNFLIILFLIVIPLIAMNMIVYHNMNKTFEAEIESQNNNSLQTVVDTLNNLYNDTNRLAAQLALQNEVQYYLYTSYYPNEGVDKTRSLLNMYTNTYDHIHSIIIYSEQKESVITNQYFGPVQEYADQTWLEEYGKIDKNHTYVLPLKYDNFFPYFLSVIKPVFIDGNKLGTIIINLNIRDLRPVIESSSGEFFDSIYVVDNNTKKVLYNKEISLFQKTFTDLYDANWMLTSDLFYAKNVTIEENQMLVSNENLESLDWSVITLLSLNRFEEQKQHIRNFMYTFIIFSIFIAFIITLIITLRTYKPLGEVISVLDKPERTLQAKNKINKNELMYIYNKIKNNYNNRLDMEKELDDRLELLNKAQMLALQAQINPHFLSNALETMKWNAMMLTGGENDLSKMAVSLSKLLRLTIGSDQNIISIGTEIELDKKYVHIMEMRFKDQFKVEWNLNEKLLEYETILLTLQPIIENAIYHGIRPMKKFGTIVVEIQEHEECIRWIVKDNGIGMHKEELDKLNTHLQDKFNLEGTHVGIRNVNHRIKLLFGEEYGVKVWSERDRGTKVEVKIPKYRSKII